MTDKPLTPKGRPVRGIPWSEIFERHPELSPPGYSQTVAKIKADKGRR